VQDQHCASVLYVLLLSYIKYSVHAFANLYNTSTYCCDITAHAFMFAYTGATAAAGSEQQHCKHSPTR
jgi:hypothetical protein